MWLWASIWTNGMFLAGMALLLLILLRRSYRYYGTRPSRKATQRSLVETPRQADKKRSLSSAPPDVLRWHVEMHETARELKAELDSKMRVLQLLIAQARQESERLERILGQSETDAAHRSRPFSEATQRPSANTALPRCAEHRSEILALARQGHSAAEIAQRLGAPVGDVELILSLR